MMDEIGFWRLEGSADCDAEIQTSIRRGMINFDRTELIKISSPYMKTASYMTISRITSAKILPTCWYGVLPPRS